MHPTFPVLNQHEAARLITHMETVGFGGFTPAGSAKVIPRALAQYAEEEHRVGNPFKVGVITGASTGHSIDGALARADAVLWRTPYQSDPDMRDAINQGRTRFFDMHLSLVPQYIRYGYLGNVDWAIVEACDISADGEIVLTASVGASPTLLRCADNILIEINRRHPTSLRGFHDIYEPGDPPGRGEIPSYIPSSRIGWPVAKVNPAKIRGVVYNEEDDESKAFKTPTRTTETIGENVAEFLASELKRHRLPPGLPVQSGVGNIANAVLQALGMHPDIPAFEMYSEVLQDAVIDLILEGKIKFASGTSLSLSSEKMKVFYENLDFFRNRMILRPQEITNNPEIVRRLGVISINTAVEVDIFGNVNSTHVLGSKLMNGIGGSGDFTRSAYLSMFVCPSTVKGGKITTIVPHCGHIDHSEHSVQSIVTEQGYALLRCKDPSSRARNLIDHCAHPDYREDLTAYFESASGGYTPQTFGLAFAMHQKFLETGDMHDVDWGIVSRISSFLRSAREPPERIMQRSL
jgi:succinate CoA transferase